MSTFLRFLFGGIPPRRTHQGGVRYCRDDKARGGVRVYIDGAHRMEAWQIRDAIRRQLPEGWIPSGEAAEVCVTLVYPQRKSDRLQPDVFIPHTEKPDADNLVKTILDQMQASGVLKNDAQIFDLRVRKFRSEVPRWSIDVTLGGYGFMDGARMALGELMGAIKQRRRKAQLAREEREEGDGQGEIEFGKEK